MSHRSAVNLLRNSLLPLAGAPNDYNALLDMIGDARFVLLGEASHGSYDFYHARAEITRRLIKEKGFTAVVVEADWPDAYRVNRYVRGMGGDAGSREALGGFLRFPQWMWRNNVLVDFIDWLRAYNENRESAKRVGFYGLDLYSLYASIESVLSYLDKVDPAGAAQARARYGCFDRFERDEQAYGYEVGLGMSASCEQEVVSQLVALRRRAAEYAQRDGQIAPDDYFFAEQNARVIINAERYYRSMLHGRAQSWNLRDQHMAETLDVLAAYLESHGQAAKVAVWAHNSHLGDARATEMSERGELNIGQLVREQYDRAAVNIGFTTFHGAVTAASDWGGYAERKRVRPALAGSYEELFHSLGADNFMLLLRDNEQTAEALHEPRLERAIGVIYRPETERMSHYFYARLPQQFDAVIHFDETQAVTPLEPGAQWQHGEVPETFPTGI